VIRYDYGEAGPHRALADALACRAVWRYLTVPEERQRVEAIKQEEEIQWQARHHLQWWELEEQRARQRFEARMTRWWQWWWLRRPQLEPARPSSIADYDTRYTARRDAYVHTFTGYATLDILQDVERAEALGLPCYRRKPDIPAELKPYHWFRTHTDPWISHDLRERAYYISTSGRSFWWLYDTRDVEVIRQRHLPRYQGGWPAGLATASQLRRQGLPRTRIATLPPVAEYYSRLNHCWYPLYTKPAREEASVHGQADQSGSGPADGH
jgi:hypothetical protein